MGFDLSYEELKLDIYISINRNRWGPHLTYEELKLFVQLPQQGLALVAFILLIYF
ncbi:hypothetical protein B4064_1141 [Caldibacillus thermoamylovorans]|nr:hypothetical protein B4064_1141 [Caldibacillus thermoamylovorans]